VCDLPLRVSFGVHCSAARAFDVWTSQISAWWPTGCSASGERAPRIVLEPWIGGRIYERTSEGVELDWGEVVEWEPPRRLVYRWRLHECRADATEVAVSFIQRRNSTTRVRIEHRDWQHLCSRRSGREAAEEEMWREFSPAAWTPPLQRASGCAGPYWHVAESERRVLVEEPLLNLLGVTRP
jgi:uncharacterized protein YndB with AHSA1/START domain